MLVGYPRFFILCRMKNLLICICAALLSMAPVSNAAEPAGDLFAKAAEGLRAKMASAETPSLKGLPNIITAEQRSNSLIIFNPCADWSKPEAQVWRCNIEECAGIGARDKQWFSGYIDECKPVLGGTHVLTTFSAGGVALVRVADKKIIFYAFAGRNPHSACMLPDGNIAAVSSSDNRLTVYAASKRKDGEPCREFTSYPLDFGHGAVWDARNKVLWALARNEIAKYEYNFDKGNPRLTKAASCALPPEGVVGHDLYPVPGTRYLFYTGVKGVGIFDTDTCKFEKISDEPNIKSISQARAGGELICLKAVERWWSQSVSHANAGFAPVGTCPQARIYMARWFVPEDFSACGVAP